MSSLAAAVAASEPSVTSFFSVQARAEPGVMPRVLELFAKRGLVPDLWHSAVSRPGTRLTIDIEVHVDDPGRTLLGQLSPPAPATVEIQTVADAQISAEADRLGRFRVRLPAGGPIRLRVLDVGGAGPAVETSWITV